MLRFFAPGGFRGWRIRIRKNFLPLFTTLTTFCPPYHFLPTLPLFATLTTFNLFLPILPTFAYPLSFLTTLTTFCLSYYAIAFFYFAYFFPVASYVLNKLQPFSGSQIIEHGLPICLRDCTYSH